MALLRITTDRFVAGIVIKNDTVKKAAPICRWMVGHNRQWVERYCAIKGWDVQEISSIPAQDVDKYDNMA